MHKIHKQFGFAYGHRVWSQELDIEYSLDACLACRHLHGHEGLVTVVLTADELTRGMVIDFKYLNWFKQWLDDVVDHKFIIDIHDPAFVQITGRAPSDVKYIYTVKTANADIAHEGKVGYLPLWATAVPDQVFERHVENEILESFVVVDFVPTSENLSKWFFEIITQKMGSLPIKIDSVALNETPKSQAVYNA